MNYNDICNCNLIVFCPLEKKQIKIKHSIATHLIAEEICKEEFYKRFPDMFDRTIAYKRCVIQHETLSKTIWTTCYLEKTYIKEKDNFIVKLQSFVSSLSADIFYKWADWYTNFSNNFYNLTVTSYPQLGTIFIT